MNLRRLINNLVKKADMPDMPGQSAYRSREGVQFHPLGYSSQIEHLMKSNPNIDERKMLDPMLQQQAETQAEKFISTYSKFAINLRTNAVLKYFRGMIFSMFAFDFMIDNRAKKLLKQYPEFQPAADFIESYGIEVPSYKYSEGQHASKSAGGDWWYSKYGYAYQNYLTEQSQKLSQQAQSSDNPQNRNNLMQRAEHMNVLSKSIVQKNRRQMQIVPDNIDYTSTSRKPGKSDEYPRGHLIVAPTGNQVGGRPGFGFFIQTDSGEKIPAYQGQTKTFLQKLFQHDAVPFTGIHWNKQGNNVFLQPGSNIYLPHGINNDEASVAPGISNRNRRAFMQRIENLAKSNPVEAEKIRRSLRYVDNPDSEITWKLGIKPDGTIFAFKQNGYTGNEQYINDRQSYVTNRKNTDDPNHPINLTKGEMALTKNQIENIAGTFTNQRNNQEVSIFQQSYHVKPSQGLEDDDLGPQAGSWQVSPEVKQWANDVNNPVGIDHLVAVREIAEEARGESFTHTPFEGYKVITIGPIFSSATPLEHGETEAKPFTATYRQKVDPSQTGSVVEVIRDVQWTVVANEVSLPRHIEYGKGSLNAASKVQGKADRSPNFSNLEEVESYLIETYARKPDGHDPITERTIRSGIQGIKKGAERALSAAAEIDQSSSQIQQPIQSPQSQQPSSQLQENPIVQNAKPIQEQIISMPLTENVPIVGNGTFAYVKNKIKKYANKK